MAPSIHFFGSSISFFFSAVSQVTWLVVVVVVAVAVVAVVVVAVVVIFQFLHMTICLDRGSNHRLLDTLGLAPTLYPLSYSDPCYMTAF